MQEHIIDAKGKALGRVASEAAVILQGKDDPRYEPRNAGTRRVKVLNADKVRVTGDKLKQKFYYRHSGKAGNLRKRTLEQELERNSAEVVRRAVKNMLPKNKLQAKRMRRLKVEI